MKARRNRRPVRAHRRGLWTPWRQEELTREQFAEYCEMVFRFIGSRRV